ncbi:hypothetical protein KUTeg_023437 [Tegillarca granosa]|uniref:Uncharacterized protein n=1 Tax=Tegillarca granosa TaxID=220873 RepID=A0ABQ9E272_TEGGR|nr:hypothetical protein KUTeg_022938 [Tegillarca granosa]KAJ8299377.1 hypothetical protein KUTeg_023437 [Tegillarca granosa]
MDWNQSNASMTDRRSSFGDQQQGYDVQNIHGETVDVRTKRYIVSADERSTDDHGAVQGTDLYQNIDQVSSTDFSKFKTSKQSNGKMSSGKTEVRNSSSYERLLFKGGNDLEGESESDYEKLDILAKANGREYGKPNHDSATKPTNSSNSADAASDITTPNQLTIPADGNLLSFSIDDMAAFFRAMSVDELIVQRLHRKKMDGKRFSRLKDTVMEDIGIKHPIICYFRDKSKKDRLNFML